MKKNLGTGATLKNFPKLFEKKLRQNSQKFDMKISYHSTH